MKIFLLLSLGLSLQAFAASELDQKLAGYISKFNLKPLSTPVVKNLDVLKLGQLLFTSRLLSGNNNISCVECHLPATMTHDNLPLALGEGAVGLQTAKTTRKQATGKIVGRGTPALFNLQDLNVLFWDGRVAFDPITQKFETPIPLRDDISQTLKSALAAQALFPLVTHEEMLGAKGSNKIADAATEIEAWDLLVEKLLQDAQMKTAFEKAFPGQKINIGHVGESLAEFQRNAFDYSDTPYDQYLRGDLTALNEIQKMGMDVFFNKGKCGDCHSGANLTNEEFHNVGTPQIGPGKENRNDFGRYQWDKKPENLYAFRVPPLRNVALTAPYMHDGSFKTLAQVVEHYDMIVESLTEYKLVNNWKNYVDTIADHDHSQDDQRVASLSTKLSKRLFFEEEEEKAVAEFMTTALTDKKFLNREVDGDYTTYLRLQLKKSGYEKLSRIFTGEASRDSYYYFDLIAEGSFALRSLTQPISLIVIKNNESTSLVFREQAYKTATSVNGVVMAGNFNRQEVRSLPHQSFDALEASYLDMFSRIYTYHDGTRDDEIPATELSIIKSDLTSINEEFHKLKFEGQDRISDQMNVAKADLFYVPTSFNQKDTLKFERLVAGKTLKGNLQKSFIRTAKGGIEVTYALELETEKVSKADYQKFTNAVLEELNVLEATDVGGGSPSPSELTLDVLKKVL
jgi:cytochrome c peroxidase